MNMMSAPIFITVYDRPLHFKACIESLLRSPLAINSELYISSDGPSDDYSAIKVSEVREYIKRIHGFRKVIPFLPKKNTNGQIRYDSLEKVRSDNSTYITTEDDNIFSPFALDFFNAGLERYRDEHTVHAICGYMPPGFPANHSRQVYLKCCDSWGIGLWRDRDLDLDLDRLELANEVLKDRFLYDRISAELPHLPVMIKAISDRVIAPAGDVTRNIMLVKKNMVCVYPSISVVRNIGVDGTGLHCGVQTALMSQEISSEKITFCDGPLVSSDDDAKWIANYYGGYSVKLFNKALWYQINAKSYIARFVCKCFAKLISLITRKAKL